MGKKIIALVFVVLIISSIGSVAYADFEIDPLSSSNHEFELLYPTERFVVTQNTEFWRYMPYSQINNELICYMSVNDTLNIGPYYTDVNGDGWFYCRIMNCAAAPYLNGSYGYISANCVKTVV